MPVMSGSALEITVKKIFEGYDYTNTTNKNYSFWLHTDELDIRLDTVVRFDITRNYVENLADDISVEFTMPLGDFILDLYPKLTNLEFSLYETVTIDKESKIRLYDRYRAVIHDDLLKKYRTNYTERYDRETLNHTGLETITMALLDRAYEALRIKTVQGVIRDKPPEDIIAAMLLNEADKILIDGNPAIDDIDVVPPSITDKIKHLVIPSGTQILRLPTLIQNKFYGVYTEGLGTYVQRFGENKYIFVYPLYDMNRYDKEAGEKLVICSLPENDYPLIDSTWLTKETITYIVATGNKDYTSNVDTPFVSGGVGIRGAKAEAYMGKPVEVREDGPKAHRTKLNYNVAHKELKDKITHVSTVSNGPISNPLKHYSHILSQDVNTVTLNWNNADIDVFYPCIPVTYNYLKGKKVVTVKGVAAGVHLSIQKAGNQHDKNVGYTVTAGVVLTVSNFEDNPETV